VIRKPHFMADILPRLKEQIKNDKLNDIPTEAFPTWKISSGELHTVVATSNTGKTFLTWGTAMTMTAEGRKVGVITTEDSEKQIVKWMSLYKPDEEIFGRIYVVYVEQLTEQDLRDLLFDFSQNVDVLMIDYIQASMMSEFRGDLYHAMGRIYTILRGSMEKNNYGVIATIQANASLYKNNIMELIEKNEDAIGAGIDGGMMTIKKSHFLAVLVRNEQGKRGLYVVKAKGEFHYMVGAVYAYGSVSDNFMISYQRAPMNMEEFMNWGKIGNGPQNKNKGTRNIE